MPTAQCTLRQYTEILVLRPCAYCSTKLVAPVGFEPTSVGLKARYSCPLNYEAVVATRRIELRFSVCDTGVLPLNEAAMVEQTGVEPAAKLCPKTWWVRRGLNPHRRA